MTDLRALTDAFAELERRADAASASAGLLPEVPTRVRLNPVPRRGARLVPVAATVAVVAGLVAGAALLAPDGNREGNRDAPVGAPPATGETVAQPAFAVPDTPEDLAARFRTVLGDLATFTVTDTGAVAVLTAPASPGAVPSAQQVPVTPTFVGAAIVGTLTASGVTGGYDLQIYPTDANEQARCDGPESPRCTVQRLPDGSSLATEQVALDGSPNGVTYLVSLVRPDGVAFLMHVSNERSPKGHSELLAPQPPLTIDQMIAIVTSDRW